MEAKEIKLIGEAELKGEHRRKKNKRVKREPTNRNWDD